MAEVYPQFRYPRLPGPPASAPPPVAAPPVGTPLESEETRLRRALAETQAKLERVTRAKSTNIRISDKGAVSVYGLGKFPVTLYADQWRLLIGQAETIEQFLDDHQDTLARK
jgi:hypothetical protein